MTAKRMLLSLFAGLCLVPLHAQARGANIKIIITTDVHGKIMTDPERGQIGYALLKSYVDAVSASGWRVFLLDSGDVFSGSAHAQADHGRSIARLLGMMGYRVLTPGNHAFDHNEANNDPLYYSRVLLKTVAEHAAGPVTTVACNVSRYGGELPGVDRNPVIIYDETENGGEGLRVIVAGVATPYTARPSLRDSVPGYDFGLREDPETTKRGILATLTESLAEYSRPDDVVVVLSHLGSREGQGRDDPISGQDLAGVTNVDFVADGHTHTAIAPHARHGAWYGNGGRHLENFLEITLDADGGRAMELKSFEDVRDLPPDSETAEWLDDMERRLGLDEVVCQLPNTDIFGDAELRTGNTPLGRLLCRCMARAAGTGMAALTVGNIRDGLPGGTVYARTLHDVLPFGDDLVVAAVSGRDLESVFARGTGRGGRGLPQFYGLTVYAWRGENDVPQPIGILDADGAPLENERRYPVAMSSIMAKATGVTVERRCGGMVGGIIGELSQTRDWRLDELSSADALLVFPDADSAREAWETAVAGQGSGIPD